jgi:hypothetical protein
MREQASTAPGRGLSWFLISYLLMLFSVLILVHGLQPEGERPGSSSRSPVHQERQKTTRPAIPPQPGKLRPPADDGAPAAADRV